MGWSDRRLTLEVATLEGERPEEDAVAERLLAGLLGGGDLRGTGVRAELDAAGEPMALLRETTWADVTAAPLQSRCLLAYASPVTFKRGDDYLPERAGDPGAVVGSLMDAARAWALHRGEPWGDVRPGDLGLVVTGSAVVEVGVDLRRPGARASTGWLEVAATTPDAGLQQSLGSWLALAPYAGVGYGTAFGLGAVRVAVPS